MEHLEPTTIPLEEVYEKGNQDIETSANEESDNHDYDEFGKLDNAYMIPPRSQKLMW